MNFSSIELPSNRKFGVFFAGIFSLTSGYFFYQNAVSIAWVSAGLAFMFLFLAFIRPELLLPLNKLWMGLGFLLGMIVSPIVLGAIFFLIFTPIGLLMRLVGRDELRLKPIISSSYWKVRNPKGPTADSFKNQF